MLIFLISVKVKRKCFTTASYMIPNEFLVNFKESSYLHIYFIYLKMTASFMHHIGINI